VKRCKQRHGSANQRKAEVDQPNPRFLRTRKLRVPLKKGDQEFCPPYAKRLTKRVQPINQRHRQPDGNNVSWFAEFALPGHGLSSWGAGNLAAETSLLSALL
jgi:hypothetical protein